MIQYGRSCDSMTVKSCTGTLPTFPVLTRGNPEEVVELNGVGAHQSIGNIRVDL